MRSIIVGFINSRKLRGENKRENGLYQVFRSMVRYCQLMIACMKGTTSILIPIAFLHTKVRPLPRIGAKVGANGPGMG
jgi:hypothetical protein